VHGAAAPTKGGRGSGVLRKEMTLKWASWDASASGPNAPVGQRGKSRKMRRAGCQGYRAETGLGRDEE
jgi:hypothetical protein